MKRIIRYLFKRAQGGEKGETEDGGREGDKKEMARKGEGTSETMRSDFVGGGGGGGGSKGRMHERARERTHARTLGSKAAAGETVKGRIESVPVVSQYLHLMSRLVKT